MTEQLSEREQTVTDQAAVLLSRMAEQRSFRVPTVDEDPREVHRLLREDLRARLDAAETLMGEMGRVRRRAQRLAAKARAEAEDAYNEKLASLAEKAIRLEYQSVRDREAMARVHASPLVRQQREAERVLSMVEEAEELMRSMFFGLKDIRRELLDTLEHFLPWEASLER